MTYEDVCEQVRSVFPDIGEYATKYRDEEGDLCTLSDSTFQDFLSHADCSSGQKLLKLEIIPSQDGQSQRMPPHNTGDPAAAGVAAGMAEAAAALSRPEVQAALQSLPGNMQGLANLAQAFGGPAAAGGAPAAPTADQTAAFEDKVKQLVEMGFGDEEAMRAILAANDGNLDAAIEELAK